MYSFLDLGASLLQGNKIQESAIKFLVKVVRFCLFRLILFSQALSFQDDKAHECVNLW